MGRNALKPASMRIEAMPSRKPPPAIAPRLACRQDGNLSQRALADFPGRPAPLGQGPSRSLKAGAAVHSA